VEFEVDFIVVINMVELLNAESVCS
jgi:hypothetical protein